MLVTYPLLTVTDDSGAIQAGATVTIASVTDKAGNAIASPGATVNLAGPNVSVDYDAAAKGEAWITLTISKSGATFSGTNATPSFYLAGDSGRLLGGVTLAAGCLDIATLTATAQQLMVRGYLVSTGATTPATADTWGVAGLYSGVAYYRGAATGTYAWTDGSAWYLTSTAPGATLPAAYWKTAAGATAVGAYAAQGTATGVPSVVAHGNAILSAFQPDGPVPANVAGYASGQDPGTLAWAATTRTLTSSAPILQGLPATVTAVTSASVFTVSLDPAALGTVNSYLGRKVCRTASAPGGQEILERGTILSAALTGNAGAYVLAVTLNAGAVPAIQNAPALGEVVRIA